MYPYLHKVERELALLQDATLQDQTQYNTLEKFICNFDKPKYTKWLNVWLGEHLSTKNRVRFTDCLMERVYVHQNIQPKDERLKKVIRVVCTEQPQLHSVKDIQCAFQYLEHEDVEVVFKASRFYLLILSLSEGIFHDLRSEHEPKIDRYGNLSGNPNKRTIALKIENSGVITGPRVNHQIIETPESLPIVSLTEGATCQKAVCRIVQLNSVATGFLVGDWIIVTNNHVIPSVGDALKSFLQFNYQENKDGTDAQTDDWELDPLRFFYTSKSLDFTFVAVKPKTRIPKDTTPTTAGACFGVIPLPTGAIPVSVTTCLQTVHHPAGRKKESVSSITLDSVRTNVIKYTTKTEPGNSGSPVFNSRWELVALHHAGGQQAHAGTGAGTWLNVGIRADVIVDALRKYFGSVSGGSDILSELSIIN